MRILFICKKNECYGFQTYTRRSSGLFNSTRFIVEGLVSKGVDASIVEVLDNNDIDREVTLYKPDVVIIEALWVVPEKFAVLKPLHPNVKWFVHMHSGMPFLALEGIAMDWINRYQAYGVELIANSVDSYDALKVVSPEVTYLPNVYIGDPRRSALAPGGPLKIGCFGALRPMKNHLLQALAAIKFAQDLDQDLIFYVNSTRIEVGGEPVIKNLRQLFAKQLFGRITATLRECDWQEPDDFLGLLQTLDIGMQVSLTETFNVVSADYVTAGLPIVVSKEVAWASHWCKALDNSVDDIVKILHRVHGNRWLIFWNQVLLAMNSREAQNLWFSFVQSQS